MLSVVWVGWVGQCRKDGLNEEGKDFLDIGKYVCNQNKQTATPLIEVPCMAHRGRIV